LVKDLDLNKLAALTTHVKLEDVQSIAAEIVQGKIRGRVVVDL
jgi:acrylyl-CoA reductase (NADPH)